MDRQQRHKHFYISLERDLSPPSAGTLSDVFTARFLGSTLEPNPKYISECISDEGITKLMRHTKRLRIDQVLNLLNEGHSMRQILPNGYNKQSSKT